jgi:hypothetical protein
MKSKTFTLRLSLILAIIAGPLLDELNAIPAFARKYQISCQVCHSPASPRLKAFGDDFAGAGFRMTEYDAPRYFVPVGDDKLSLIRDFPIAVRLDGHITYNNENRGAPDFGLPYALKLMSGGELSDKLSYYFYFYMNERGKVAGVEDAFLMFSDVLGTGINLYLGQFQVSDPLFKRELRLTLEDYVIYTVAPGNSSIGLKYDRGILLEYGLPTGTDIIAEVVNGNGLPQAGEGHIFDRDKHKSYLLKLNQGIGDFLSIGYLLRRNIRLVGEYTRIFGNDNYGRASVGFVSAF